MEAQKQRHHKQQRLPHKEQRTTKHNTIMATFTTPTQQYIRQWHILTIQRPLVCRCKLTVNFDFSREFDWGLTEFWMRIYTSPATTSASISHSLLPRRIRNVPVC